MNVIISGRRSRCVWKRINKNVLKNSNLEQFKKEIQEKSLEADILVLANFWTKIGR